MNRIIRRLIIALYFMIVWQIVPVLGDTGVIPVITKVETGSVLAPDIDVYHGVPFVLLNDNIPSFSIQELTTKPYLKFSPLDSLGRTGPGMGCLGKETLPNESRGQIGNVRPSGWHTIRYDDLIQDKFLYNRCHVLGYQLSGDNATPENLFTGTRYLNSETMVYFENMVASYLNGNGDKHVIYRVTPVYEENNLVASGVQMEAYSVEDHGEGICFNVYLYNVQPGVEIDYSDGSSEKSSDYVPVELISPASAYRQLTGSGESDILKLEATETSQDNAGTNSRNISVEENEEQITYILNTNTKKFHYPECGSVFDMKEKNKKEFTGSRDEVISKGYVPCKRCNP